MTFDISIKYLTLTLLVVNLKEFTLKPYYGFSPGTSSGIDY